MRIPSEAEWLKNHPSLVERMGETRAGYVYKHYFLDDEKYPLPSSLPQELLKYAEELHPAPLPPPPSHGFGQLKGLQTEEPPRTRAPDIPTGFSTQETSDSFTLPIQTILAGQRQKWGDAPEPPKPRKKLFGKSYMTYDPDNIVLENTKKGFRLVNQKTGEKRNFRNLQDIGKVFGLSPAKPALYPFATGFRRLDTGQYMILTGDRPDGPELADIGYLDLNSTWHNALVHNFRGLMDALGFPQPANGVGGVKLPPSMSSFFPKSDPNAKGQLITFGDVETNDKGKIISNAQLKLRYNEQKGRLEFVDEMVNYYTPAGPMVRTSDIHGMDIPKLNILRRLTETFTGRKVDTTYSPDEMKRLMEFWEGGQVATQNGTMFDMPKLLGSSFHSSLNDYAGGHIDILAMAEAVWGKGANTLEDIYLRTFHKTMSEAGLSHHDATSDTVAVAQIFNAWLKDKGKLGKLARAAIGQGHRTAGRFGVGAWANPEVIRNAQGASMSDNIIPDDEFSSVNINGETVDGMHYEDLGEGSVPTIADLQRLKDTVDSLSEATKHISGLGKSGMSAWKDVASAISSQNVFNTNRSLIQLGTVYGNAFRETLKDSRGWTDPGEVSKTLIPQIETFLEATGLAGLKSPQLKKFANAVGMTMDAKILAENEAVLAKEAKEKQKALDKAQEERQSVLSKANVDFATFAHSISYDDRLTDTQKADFIQRAQQFKDDFINNIAFSTSMSSDEKSIWQKNQATDFKHSLQSTRSLNALYEKQAIEAQQRVEEGNFKYLQGFANSLNIQAKDEEAERKEANAAFAAHEKEKEEARKEREKGYAKDLKQYMSAYNAQRQKERDAQEASEMFELNDIAQSLSKQRGEGSWQADLKAQDAIHKMRGSKWLTQKQKDDLEFKAIENKNEYFRAIARNPDMSKAEMASRATDAQRDYNEALKKTIELNKTAVGVWEGLNKHVKGFNFLQLQSAYSAQVGGIAHAAHGILPNWLEKPIFRGGAALQNLQRDWFAGIQKNYNIGSNVFNGILGAAAPVALANPIAGGVVAAVGAIGKIGMNVMGENQQARITKWGEQVQFRLNLLGMTVDTLLAPLRLFRNGLHLTVGLFTRLSKLWDYMPMGTQYGLSGVRTDRWQPMAASDRLMGFQTGTINSMYNNLALQQGNLYTSGKFNEGQLVAAARLGIFNLAYAPMGSGSAQDQQDKIIDTLRAQYNAAPQGSAQRQMLQSLINDYDPNLITIIERMNGLGLSRASQLRYDWNQRFLKDGEKAFVANASWNFDLTKRSATEGLSKVGAKLWEPLGKPVMGMLNTLLWDFADGKGIDWAKLKSSLANIWDNIIKLFNIDSLKSAFNIDFKFDLDSILSKIEGWIGRIFDFLADSFAKHIGSFIEDMREIGLEGFDIGTLVKNLIMNPENLFKGMDIRVKSSRDTARAIATEWDKPSRETSLYLGGTGVKYSTLGRKSTPVKFKGAETHRNGQDDEVVVDVALGWGSMEKLSSVGWLTGTTDEDLIAEENEFLKAQDIDMAAIVSRAVNNGNKIQRADLKAYRRWLKNRAVVDIVRANSKLAEDEAMGSAERAAVFNHLAKRMETTELRDMALNMNPYSKMVDTGLRTSGAAIGATASAIADNSVAAVKEIAPAVVQAAKSLKAIEQNTTKERDVNNTGAAAIQQQRGR